MRVRFTLEALGHIAGIRTYIEKQSPTSAAELSRKSWQPLIDWVSSLISAVWVWRPGRVSGP